MKVICSNNLVEVFEYQVPVRTGTQRPGRKGGRPKGSKKSSNPNIRKRTIIKAKNTLKRLVYLNFQEGSKFITLSYRDGALADLSSIEESNKYFKLFIQRLQYRIGKFKYIAVPQFQTSNGRNAVHYHIIADLPNVPQQELKDIWGAGSAHIQRIYYLSMKLINYMTKDFADERLEGKKDFFASKNLDRPTILYGEEANLISQNLKHQKTAFRSTYKSKFNGGVAFKEYRFKDS